MWPYKGIAYISVLNKGKIVKVNANKWPEGYWLCFPNFVRKPGWPGFHDQTTNQLMTAKNLVLYLPMKIKR